MIAAAVCNLRDYATSVMTKRNFWDDGIYATFFLPGIWLGDMSCQIDRKTLFLPILKATKLCLSDNQN